MANKQKFNHVSDHSQSRDMNNPTFSDWKSLFHSITRSSEPSNDIINAQKGTSYIYAQAMERENPAFFYALGTVVIYQQNFEVRLYEKTMALEGDDEDLAKLKRRLSQLRSKATFEDLCDPAQFAMRGKVRELMGRFREAMEFAGTSLTELEKDKIGRFVDTVEKNSQPQNIPAPAKLQRAPA